MVITEARTIRAKLLAQEKASAIIRFTVLGPNRDTITTAVMMFGME